MTTAIEAILKENPHVNKDRALAVAKIIPREKKMIHVQAAHGKDAGEMIPDESDDPFTPTPEELKLINQYTLRKFEAKDLWVVEILSCDNQPDRHNERLLPKALEKLGKTFKGKPGLADHRWSSASQNMRIFDAFTKMHPDVQSEVNGESYTALHMKVYMLRLPDNETLRLEVEGGIKKETSVGFFLSWLEIKCSICSDAIFNWDGKCSHIPGREYEGEKCLGLIDDHDRLEGVENSWVAVPAQPKAGAVKNSKDAEGEELRQQLLYGKEKRMEAMQLLSLLKDPAQRAKMLEGATPEVAAEIESLLSAKSAEETPAPETPETPAEETPAPAETPAEETPAAPAEEAPPTPTEEQKSVTPTTTQAQTLGATEIAEIVKKGVAEAMKSNDERYDALKTVVDDLKKSVEAKLAIAPGGPLNLGVERTPSPENKPEQVKHQSSKPNLSQAGQTLLDSLIITEPVSGK